LVKHRQYAVTQPNVRVVDLDGAIFPVVDPDLVVGIVGSDDDVELRRDHQDRRGHRRRRREIQATYGNVVDGVVGRFGLEDEVEDAGGNTDKDEENDEEAEEPAEAEAVGAAVDFTASEALEAASVLRRGDTVDFFLRNVDDVGPGQRYRLIGFPRWGKSPSTWRSGTRA
jgi:hypothetical protein